MRLRYFFVVAFLKLVIFTSQAQEYDIKSFGAIGDGNTNDTQAIQSAIDSCSVTGGTVIFPQGNFLTGMIEIKSNVTIYLSHKATWSGIPDTTLYPPVPVNERRVFIYANSAENIGITGAGTINGNGDRHDVFPAQPGGKRIGIRPYGLLFWKCRNVKIQDVTLKNSAFWMFRPDQCEDVQINGVKVYNHSNYNNDGFDISDCHRVTISDCILDCEDDALCFKSHSDKGNQDIVVTNCILSSHASAIKLGTGSYGSFRRMTFSNIIIKPSLFRETLHPIELLDGIAGIDLSITDGADVSEISFDRITMDGVETAIFVRLGNRHRFYDNIPQTGTEKSKPSGSIHDITFSNIKAVNVGPVCSSISAYPGQYVEDISLSNIDITLTKAGSVEDTTVVIPENSANYPFSKMYGANLPARGLFLRHVKDIDIDRFILHTAEKDPRYDFYLEDVHGFHLQNFRHKHPAGDSLRLKSSNSSRLSY